MLTIVNSESKKKKKKLFALFWFYHCTFFMNRLILTSLKTTMGTSIITVSFSKM